MFDKINDKNKRGGDIMLKDIPYKVLTQNERDYEVMLLRDQYDNAFKDIAEEFGISIARVRQIHFNLKLKQIRLYIRHISMVLGHENCAEMIDVYNNAYECYQDLNCVCGYLEKKYKDILMEYRDGEPGMPPQFIRSLPPFRRRLNKKTIARLIEMRDVEKASFAAIGKELRITPAKAKRTYESHYHKKVLVLINALQEQAESEEEKKAIWRYYFEKYQSPKKRYDILTQGQAAGDCK